MAACLLLSATGVRAEERYGKAADNRIYAQSLVNEILAHHRNLLWAGMHGVAPGSEEHTIIASTLDVIGKKDEDSDVLVATEGRSTLVPNLEQSKLGVMLPLRDASGHRIGALALAFKYPSPDASEARLFLKATAIRDRVARRIQAVSDLFRPVP
ncbi:MAG: hypothetical protein DMF78_14115 [Acidobacteria bacterium]|nr:MAG: hypothetical protein DMF78_14115 [Acidobacteriota bacterium]